MPPLRRENTVAQIANALGGLGSALWDFLTLIISLLPNLGVRIVNILAMVALVFIATVFTAGLVSWLIKKIVESV